VTIEMPMELLDEACRQPSIPEIYGKKFYVKYQMAAVNRHPTG
jgi:hypothetical protein